MSVKVKGRTIDPPEQVFKRVLDSEFITFCQAFMVKVKGEAGEYPDFIQTLYADVVLSDEQFQEIVKAPKSERYAKGMDILAQTKATVLITWSGSTIDVLQKLKNSCQEDLIENLLDISDKSIQQDGPSVQVTCHFNADTAAKISWKDGEYGAPEDGVADKKPKIEVSEAKSDGKPTKLAN